MPEASTPEEIVRVLVQRNDILSEISDTPRTQSELVNLTENSQATVYRALTTLEELNLVTSSENEYKLTDLGWRVFEEHQSYVNSIHHDYELHRAVSQFPEPIELDSPIIEGAEAFFHESMSIGSASAPNKHLVQNANKVYTSLDGFMPSYLSAHIEPTRYSDQQVEMVLPDTIVESIIEQSKTELLSLYDTDNFQMYRISNPMDYSTTIVEMDEQTYAILLLHSSGSVICSIRITSDDGIEWARSRYEEIRQDATPVRINDDWFEI